VKQACRICNESVGALDGCWGHNLTEPLIGFVHPDKAPWELIRYYESMIPFLIFDLGRGWTFTWQCARPIKEKLHIYCCIDGIIFSPTRWRGSEEKRESLIPEWWTYVPRQSIFEDKYACYVYGEIKKK